MVKFVYINNVCFVIQIGFFVLSAFYEKKWLSFSFKKSTNLETRIVRTYPKIFDDFHIVHVFMVTVTGHISSVFVIGKSLMYMIIPDTLPFT